MAQSASNRNITYAQCIELFNRILTRTTNEQVINPTSGQLIKPNKGTAEYLISRCQGNHQNDNN